MGPIEEPFSYSKQHKDPQGTVSATVSASLAIIYSRWRPSLVTIAKLSIHSGYLPGKRPPPRAGTRLLHRLRIFTSYFGNKGERERERQYTSRRHACTYTLVRAIPVFIRYFARRSRLLSTIPVNYYDYLDRFRHHRRRRRYHRRCRQRRHANQNG